MRKRSRRLIAEASLLANSVVENLDFLSDFSFSFVASGKAMMMNHFRFQWPPAAFHRPVIPAFAYAVDESLHADLTLQRGVSMGAILANTQCGDASAIPSEVDGRIS